MIGIYLSQIQQVFEGAHVIRAEVSKPSSVLVEIEEVEKAKYFARLIHQLPCKRVSEKRFLIPLSQWQEVILAVKSDQPVLTTNSARFLNPERSVNPGSFSLAQLLSSSMSASGLFSSNKPSPALSSPKTPVSEKNEEGSSKDIKTDKKF